MNKRTLKFKFSMIFGLMTVAICAVLWIFSFYQTRKVLLEGFTTKGISLVEDLAYQSQYAVFSEDRTSLENLSQGVLNLEDVVYVDIFNLEGKRVARKIKRNFISDLREDIEMPPFSPPALVNRFTQVESYWLNRKEEVFHFTSPVFLNLQFEKSGPLSLRMLGEEDKHVPKENDEKKIGWVRIGMSPSHLNQEFHQILIQGFFVTILLMMTGVFLIYWLAKHYFKPLETLSWVSRKISEGDFSQKAPIVSQDEVGELTGVFNQMTQSLVQRDQELKANADKLQSLNLRLLEINSTLELKVRQRTETIEHVLEEVLYEKKKSERIINEIADGVVVVNKNLQVTLINPAARKMFRLEDQLKDHDLSSRATIPVLKDIFHELGNGVIHEIELPETSESQPKIVRATVAPIQDEFGILFGYVAVLHDISRFKEVDRLKSEFVSHVSHELRTPLTSISGFIDNLRDGIAGSLSGKQSDYLDRMKKNADRLIRLIDDLLQISRIESGRIEIFPLPFLYRSMIDDVVQILSTPIREKKINLVIEYLDEIGEILGDRDKLEEVMINLLDNAIKFSPENGQVTVSFQKGRESLITSVLDQGEGISSDEKIRIFDRFYQGEHDLLSRKKGTGFGLYISKKLVELHKGQIWVVSEKGKGSQFFFTLPLTRLEK